MGAGDGAEGVASRLLLAGTAGEASPELWAAACPSGRPLSGSRARSLRILNMVAAPDGGWRCHEQRRGKRQSLRLASGYESAALMELWRAHRYA